jgi:hypothetical protein
MVSKPEESTAGRTRKWKTWKKANVCSHDNWLSQPVHLVSSLAQSLTSLAHGCLWISSGRELAVENVWHPQPRHWHCSVGPFTAWLIPVAKGRTASKTKNKKECRSWNIITKKESWNYGLERKLHTLQKNLCALWWSGWTRSDRMVTLVPLPRSRTCCSRPVQKKKRKAAHSSTRERKCWKFIGLTHVIQHRFQGDASIAWRLQWC